MTVQAPQSPSLQPSLVPHRPACSRSQVSTLVVGGRPPTSTTALRWTKRIGRGVMAFLEVVGGPAGMGTAVARAGAARHRHVGVHGPDGTPVARDSHVRVLMIGISLIAW